MSRLRSLAPVAIVGLSAALVAGCGSTGTDKAGARPAAAPTVVTLQLPDATDVDGLFLADAIGRRSHGSLVVHVDGETYGSVDPKREQGLVKALQDGTAELGFLASRDLAEAGAPAFEALQTPFLVTSSAQTVALASSPLAGELAASLDASGLVGLGLVAHEPRRLFSRRPILARDLVR